MEELSGVLNVKVVKGFNLVIRDLLRHSDPYVIIKLGGQTKKTRVIKRDLNPVWNQDLTFNIANVSDRDRYSLTAEVWDKDRFTRDDFMGKAEYDLKPLVAPSTDSNHVKGSHIVQQDGPTVQDVRLKLERVHSGHLELKLEWQPAH